MANKLAERLGGWDKVIAGVSQPEQDRPGAKHWTGSNPSHNRDDWADAWGTARRSYREEMRQHEAWVRQQAEAFKREMGENSRRAKAEHARAEHERKATEREKVQAQNTDWAKVDPASRQAYDDNFKWTEDDIEKMKWKLEMKMREKGLWKDGI